MGKVLHYAQLDLCARKKINYVKIKQSVAKDV